MGNGARLDGAWLVLLVAAGDAVDNPGSLTRPPPR
jgi:hypothetical protein